MKASSSFRPKIGLVVVLGAIAVIAFLPVSESHLDGRSRLLSIEPLPAMDGAMCEMPAGASLRATAALRQQQPVATAGDTSRAAVARRRPLRTIHDEHAVFSAVAVDAVRNEVVLQDENLFRILVYDRTATTPPTATMTEPKRIIGGPLTHLELNSGVYIDSKTGNIYAVNNDTEDHMTVFGRQAEGNVAPSWKLQTPRAFSIAVDEATQELFLTGQHSNSVTIFSKTAKNDDPPTGVLQGDRTRLADPHGIALDPKANLLFVSNFGSTASPRSDIRNWEGMMHGRHTFKQGAKPLWPMGPGQMIPGSGRTLPPSITVYARNARGDIAPLRVIQGPTTQLNWPSGLAVDPEHGELYVANDGGDSVLVFSTSASGDATPIRVLKGPQTLIKYPVGVFVDLVNDELWVASLGSHAATAYGRTASGNTAPVRMIRSAPRGTPAPLLGNVRLAYDTKREEILAPN